SQKDGSLLNGRVIDRDATLEQRQRGQGDYTGIGLVRAARCVRPSTVWRLNPPKITDAAIDRPLYRLFVGSTSFESTDTQQQESEGHPSHSLQRGHGTCSPSTGLQRDTHLNSRIAGDRGVHQWRHIRIYGESADWLALRATGLSQPFIRASE